MSRDGTGLYRKNVQHRQRFTSFALIVVLKARYWRRYTESRTLHYRIMAELESKIQARIIKRLESEGYYVVKLILTNKNGIPDLLVLKDGKAFFVEVKRPGENPRPLQEYRINELRELGFICEVWKE